jgi:hypothetical protein
LSLSSFIASLFLSCLFPFLLFFLYFFSFMSL